MIFQDERKPHRAATAVRATLMACAAALLLSGVAQAADCPGNPNALGTSRTLVVDPAAHPRIGTMQYSEMLPLQDHEVVLTFDDGPIPRNTNQVLDLLAAECVKATFFVVGEMVRAHPEALRRIRDNGHTIGTHSETHPLTMNRMPIEKARAQIDDGIAAATAALGEAPAPFFRIPGLMRATVVEDYLAEQGLQTWSADFPADDWHHISAEKVHALAMSRLAAKGKGVILLHDIQARTAAALPAILRDLKAGGYRIVHVVPATKDLAVTATEPQQWREHPINEQIAIRRWPAVPRFSYVDAAMLPSPAMAAVAPQGVPFDLPRRRSHSATTTQGVTYASAPSASLLPVPELSLFAIAEKTAPSIQVAIAMPRREPTPSAPAAAIVVASADHDDIGRLISATSDPETTGALQVRRNKRNAGHRIRPIKPRAVAAILSH